MIPIRCAIQREDGAGCGACHDPHRWNPADPAGSALHDVTEGGVGEALRELQRASGLSLEVDLERVPVRPETRLLCGELGIDPLGLIGSGALLVGCAGEGRERVAAALAAAGVGIEWIGRACASVGPAERSYPRFERDEILRTFAGRGIAVVVFDMDGTLIDSDYDWPSIRRRLGVSGRSIIDDLKGLPDSERAARWAELEAIEGHATGAARLKEGVPELLALRSRRRRCAREHLEERLRPGAHVREEDQREDRGRY